MDLVYRTPLDLDLDFSSARSRFDKLLELAGSADTLNLSHDEVERLVETEGRDVLRLVFQGHLDLRTAEENGREAPRGADEEERPHRRQLRRPLRSVFGDNHVVRLNFTSKEASGGLRPLDAELNLPHELYSLGLRRSASILAMDLSYDSAIDKLSALTGGKVPKRQLEELVVRAAEDFDAFYDVVQRERIQHPPVKGHDTPLLVLSTDGKGIVMRPESLREATRKKAERDKHKLETRLSAGEKRNRKRMAEVASVYDIERQPRSPGDILPRRKDEADKTPRPRAQNKRVWASVDKSLKSVVQQCFDEALSRDPDRQRNWVYLVDGNKEQIRVANSTARNNGVSLVIIIDFIHVLEYLWKAAWTFFDKGDPKVEAWVLDRARAVLEGKASSVAAGIRRSATKRQLDDKKRKGADACANYLLNNKKMLKYDEYLAAGYPIATGVIEGRADTWSMTASGSPEPAGASWEPRPSSDFEHYEHPETSRSTGASIDARNWSGTTSAATPRTSCRNSGWQREDRVAEAVAPGELHPIRTKAIIRLHPLRPSSSTARSPTSRISPKRSSRSSTASAVPSGRGSRWTTSSLPTSRSSARRSAPWPRCWPWRARPASRPPSVVSGSAASRCSWSWPASPIEARVCRPWPGPSTRLSARYWGSTSSTRTTSTQRWTG